MKLGEIPDGDYKQCIIDDCIGVQDARKMCTRHYNAWYRTSDPRRFRFVNSSGICTVDQCPRRVVQTSMLDALFDKSLAGREF